MLGIIASIIDGVLVGLVYGLAAMGLTLIWGVMNVINLTHGAMIVAGMFAVFLLVQWQKQSGKLGRQVVWPSAAKSADLIYPIAAASQ